MLKFWPSLFLVRLYWDLGRVVGLLCFGLHITVLRSVVLGGVDSGQFYSQWLCIKRRLVVMALF